MTKKLLSASPVLLLLVLVSLCCLVPVSVGCDTDLNDARGLNPTCTSPVRRFCIGGMCYGCNPFLTSESSICDCPDGLMCNQFLNQGTGAQCIVPPKYGDACSNDDQCRTTSDVYSAALTQLVCYQGKCRQCNPSTAPLKTCSEGLRNGTVLTCISPGVWGVASSTSTSTSTSPATSASAAATTIPQQSSTSSGRSIHLS